MGRERTAYLLNTRQAFVGSGGIYPSALDANLGAVEGRLVDIGDGTRGDRVGTGDQMDACQRI